MSNKYITSNLIVDLSTAEQQLLSGGQNTGKKPFGGQSPYGGQLPSGEQPLFPSNEDYSRRYPTYICRPVYGDDGGSSGGEQ
ncbi:hypothetical protein [Nostoc sp. FACHB-280]|uniref:hypothetical protein n=1 Tax=Nostoc sp. FACHB-280 TaxID=2692839 RepID=UPI00168AEBC7|nr:hypothetical protein [Nostoc sp. FACHB-280]MBD2495069.1 hypothetical protein [Nostoc sp. FACHB-280]